MTFPSTCAWSLTPCRTSPICGCSDRSPRSKVRFILSRSGFRIWNTGSNRVGWSAYLGGADPAEAVPARRDDLAGLPPAWLGVGTQDLFHDEGVRHAKRLRDAGVPCVLHVSPGGFHGFDQVAPKAPVSRAYFDSQCTSISNAVALVR